MARFDPGILAASASGFRYLVTLPTIPRSLPAVYNSAKLLSRQSGQAHQSDRSKRQWKDSGKTNYSPSLYRYRSMELCGIAEESGGRSSPRSMMKYPHPPVVFALKSGKICFCFLPCSARWGLEGFAEFASSINFFWQNIRIRAGNSDPSCL